MTASRASGAFVCLRCELQAVRPRAPRSRPSLPHAKFSTSTARNRDAFDEYEDAAAARKSAPTEAAETPKIRKVLHDRVRKRKGQTAIHEKEVMLDGLKTMGSESGILVLREIADDAETVELKRRKAAEELAKQKEMETLTASEALTPGILAQLEAEGTVLGQEELNKQLESLRPKSHEQQYITLADYRKLSQQLLKGFTAQQLSSYLVFATGVKERRLKKEASEKGSSEGKRVVGRSRWQPGTTPLTRRLPISGAIDVLPKRKLQNKSQLVDLILRDAWDVVLMDEIEAPGELEVLLKPWQVTLLNAGSGETGLDKVGAMRKAKMEISWPSTIRITAAKSNAEYAADDIENFLKDTVVDKFDLKPWAHRIDDRLLPAKLVKVFPPQFQQTVGRLSGATVQVISEDMVQIRALSKDALEDARRLLINLLPLKSSTELTFETAMLEAEKDHLFFVPTPFPDSTPHSSRHHRHTLGRWTAPVLKQEAPSDVKEDGMTATPFSAWGGGPSSLDDIQQRVCDAVSSQWTDETLQMTSLSDNPSYWSTPDTGLSASIVQTLFPTGSSTEPPQALAPSSPEDLIGALAKGRPPLSVFTHSVPGIPKIFVDNVFGQRPYAPPGYLEYTFVAAEEQHPKLSENESCPTLRIRVALTPEGAQLRDLDISFNSHHHTVLLPDRPADIQFRQTKKVKLLRAMENPAIRAFIEKVQENIASGGKLSAPPSLEIEVPRFTTDRSQQHTAGTRTLTYLFSGIQHRQNYSTRFESAWVGYAISNAGKLSGAANNVGKLALYYSRRSKKQLARDSGILESATTDASVSAEASAKPGEDEKPRIADFVRKAFRLVDVVDKAAKAPYPLVHYAARKRQNTLGRINMKGLKELATTGKWDELVAKMDHGVTTVERSVSYWKFQLHKVETGKILSDTAAKQLGLANSTKDLKIDRTSVKKDTKPVKRDNWVDTDAQVDWSDPSLSFMADDTAAASAGTAQDQGAAVETASPGASAAPEKQSDLDLQPDSVEDKKT